MAKRQPKAGMPSLQQALNAVEVDLGVLSLVRFYGEAGYAELIKIAATRSKGVTPAMRARAVHLLGVLRWRPAFAALVRLLKDGSDTVRLNAIYAVGEVGGPNAVKPLLGIVRDAKRSLTEQAHALRALAAVGDADTIAALQVWSGRVRSPELKAVANDTLKRITLALQRVGAR